MYAGPAELAAQAMLQIVVGVAYAHGQRGLNVIETARETVGARPSLPS